MLAMADALTSVILKIRIQIAMKCITVKIIFIILLQNAQTGQKQGRYRWIVMRNWLHLGHALVAGKVHFIAPRRVLAEDAISKLKRKYFENMFFI